jgi:hypothetical protein
MSRELHMDFWRFRSSTTELRGRRMEVNLLMDVV